MDHSALESRSPIKREEFKNRYPLREESSLWEILFEKFKNFVFFEVLRRRFEDAAVTQPSRNG